MSEIATASINSFGSTPPKADFVQPAEERIFVLTSQLQDLITEAVEKAIQPLQDEVRDLKATVARQDEKIATLESTASLHEENQFIQLRLIGQLRQATKKEPQPMQKDRGDILRALLAANGGKMLAKDARQKMHLTKQTFSMLIASMGEHIEIKPLHSDKRKDVIMLK